MARAKPRSGSKGRATTKPKTKAKSSLTSAKPSARANKPVATSRAAKPAKSTSAKPRSAAAKRSHGDTIVEPAAEVAPDEAADPARTAELAALEDQLEALTDPDLLVALASRIDTLGMQLAYEISRHADDAAHIAPLKPVLMRVPALYGKTLLRAAEKFDDLGSPRRAAYVLFEALRKAFDPDVITAIASALSFVLEAHGQSKPARAIRELLAEREERRAAGVERREVRTQFAAALEALRDGGVDWDALDDVADQFD